LSPRAPTIRPETANDTAAIRRVIDAAFADAPHASGTESAIVEALRAEGSLTISLVAVAGGAVIGHVAASPVTIEGVNRGWSGLGPLSVLPAHQRCGIGTALVRELLSRLQAAGALGCVVLGEPGYYRRFGFGADPALTFTGVPPEYFMRLAFAGAVPEGTVTYRPAFSLAKRP
jgi:putative acetyltransferase